MILSQKNEQYGTPLLLHGGNNKSYQKKHCQEKGGADNMLQHFVLMHSQQAHTHHI